MTEPQPPDFLIAFDVTHDGNERHAFVRMNVATAKISTTIVLTVDEAAQLLAQLPETLGEQIRAARRQASGIAVARDMPKGDPRVTTRPQTGH